MERAPERAKHMMLEFYALWQLHNEERTDKTSTQTQKDFQTCRFELRWRRVVESVEKFFLLCGWNKKNMIFPGR